MIEKEKQTKVSKDISFAELIQKHPEAVEVLLERGMHCIGCPMSQQESLEQGALAHGLDPSKLVEEINKKIKEEKSKK